MHPTDPSPPTSVPRNELRAHAEALRLLSRNLRTRSARILVRRDATVHTLQVRREMLHAEFQQVRALRRSARGELATSDDDAQDWMAGEVVEMIARGWSRRALAEVGIGPELLRELRLDKHPALRDTA